MRILSTIALVFIFTLAASFAQAATINVPADYTTIQGAIDNAVAGDEILVGPGTYNESPTILTDNITLKSTGGRDVTIINAQGATNALSIGDVTGSFSPTGSYPQEITVDGFTISNWTERGIAQRLGNNSITIINNHIISQGPGSRNNGIVVSGGEGTIIQNNLVEVFSWNNPSVSSAGILLAGTSNATIQSNTISGGDVGIAVMGAFGGINPGWAQATNNQIFENDVSAIQSAVSLQGDGVSTTTIQNNTLDAIIGLSIEKAGDGTLEVLETVLEQNNLLNDVGVDNADNSSTVEASFNYWDCSQGPDNLGCAQTAGDVSASIWLCEPAPTGETSVDGFCADNNFGTINTLYYNENATWVIARDSLRVWGQAPLGADTATAYLRLADQTVIDSVTVPVQTLGSNEQSYNIFFDEFSSYDPEKYHVVVDFFDNGVRMDGFAVSEDVNTLFLWQLSEDLAQTIANLEALNESVEEEFLALQDVLDSMSQGTIEWRYFEDSNTYEFQGEIPNVADFDPRFWIVDKNGDTVYQTTGTGDFIYGPHNPLHSDPSFWKLILDASLLDAGIYTVNLDFERGTSEDRWSVATITELSVLDLESRVATLEEQVKSIQGDLSLVWDSDEDRLRVKLFFPPNSTEARIYAYDSNDEQRFGPITVSDTGTPRQQDYDWNVSEWPIDSYTIKVNFLGTGDFSPWRSELFDNLLTRWLAENEFGFEFVESRAFEVFNPQSGFRRDISFAFTPEEDGEWQFGLDQRKQGLVDFDISREWGSCTAVNAKETVVFPHRGITFPPTEGEYWAVLTARNCDTGERILSNRFVMDIIDLALPLANNTAGISELGIVQGTETEVYYSSENLFSFDVLMQSTNGWSNALDCIVRFDDGLGGQDVKIWDMSEPNASGVTECGGTLDVEDITGRNLGAWTLEVCGEPQQHNPSGLDQLCDELDFMYDNTPPFIDEASLNPGIINMVAGEWTFGANVTDNGEVMTVEFTLINKTNATDMCNLGFANNTAGDQWELVYDTAGNCTTDGFYNFSVTATDFANNSATMEIDPLIDNTAPVVQGIELDGLVPQNMTIDAQITDNLAGVLAANATVTRYTCGEQTQDTNETLSCISTCEVKEFDEYQQEIELSRTSGNSFSGTWSGSFEQETGYFYKVVVGAIDGAGNEAEENNADRYARPSYEISMSVSDTQIFSNEQVNVQGIVTASDGSSLPYDMITVAGGEVPIAGNDVFAANVGTFSAGEQTINAVYEPKTVCNESFTRSLDITVEQAPSSGGGGGGGGYFAQPSTFSNGGDGEDAGDGEEQSEEPEQSDGGSGNEVQGGGEGAGEGEEQPEESQPEPQENNLLTGAVTGAGFFGDNWPWLALFGALVIALFGSYFYFRR